MKYMFLMFCATQLGANMIRSAVEWRGLTAFTRCNKHDVRFPQDNLCHFVLEFIVSPKYSGPQIIARDSHSNRLTSKIQNTSTTFLCIKFPPSNFKPSPLHPWPCTNLFLVCFAATQLARQLHQERTQVMCSNKVAQKRLAQRHSRNSCHMFVCIVVCACSRHALNFKILFFGSFVTRKGYCMTCFT